MNYCHSCGIPLTGDLINKKTDKFCTHCADEGGKLLSREAVLQGIAGWLSQITPEDKNSDYTERAGFYLKSMPAWAD